MNEAPPVPLDDLISRHFDDALSTEDHQRLATALTDREACRTFASTALLHASLEALAPPLPPRRKRPVLLWVSIGAAAAALVVGAGILFLNHRRQSSFQITLVDPDARSDGQPWKPKPPGLTKRIVKSPASAQPAGAVLDVEDLLARYYVNVSPHGLTVSQALVQLEAAIEYENVFNRPELDQLTFTATTSFDPETIDPVVYAPALASMTVARYLETCSAYRQVVRNPGSVTINPQGIPITLSSLEGPPEIRKFRVPPDFLSSLVKKASTPDGTAKEVKLATIFGVSFDEDESATFSSNPATLTVNAAPGKLDQLAMRMKLGLADPSTQVFITTHYRKLRRSLLPPGFNEESGLIISYPAYQMFDKAIHQKDSGCELFTAPSVIVRKGQKSKIELLKHTRTRDNAKVAIGLTQDVQTSATGELFRVEGLVDLCLVDGMPMPEGLSVLGLTRQGTSGIQSYQTEYELYLPDRSTALFVAESPQTEGFVTLVCLTATIIDASGEPVANPKPVAKPNREGLPVGIPVQGKPGFIYSPFDQGKRMIDVTGITTGTEVMCPYAGKKLLVP